MIETEMEFLALASEWNILLHKSSADGIFLTWEYLSAWWTVYGQKFTPCVIIARDDLGQLIGIAPFAISSGSGLRSCLRRLTFLGGACESLAERQDFIVTPGYEQHFARACWSVLLQHAGWDVLHLEYARNSSTLQAFTTAADQAGVAIEERSHPTWTAKLPETWDDFLAQRSAKFREMTRKKLRKLHANHEVKFHPIANTPEHLSQALASLIMLNNQRWKSASRSFHTPKFIQFHRCLAERFAQRDWLSLNLLEIDGAIVSARYDFRYQGRIWGFQSGWSDEHKDLSIGCMALAHTIQHAIAQGVTAFDFQAGHAPYKEQWAEPGEAVIELEIISPRRLRSHFYGLARQFRNSFS